MGSEFRERNRPNAGLAGWSSEKAHGQTFGLRVRRKEQAEPWFGRFGVRRKNLFFLFIFFIYFFLIFFLFVFLFFFIFSFLFFFLLFFFFCYFSSFFSSFFIFFLISFFYFFLRKRNRSFSQLRTCRTILRTCRTKFRPCPFSEPARVQSSEKVTGLSSNSEPAEPVLALFLFQTANLPGFGVQRKELAFHRTPNLPNQGYTRSFSELKLQTPGKNTILDHLVSLRTMTSF